MSAITLADRTRQRDASRAGMRRLRAERRSGRRPPALTTAAGRKISEAMLADRLDAARRRARFVTIEDRPDHCRFCSHKTSDAERICSFCRAELEGGGLPYCRDLLEQLGASVALPADGE